MKQVHGYLVIEIIIVIAISTSLLLWTSSFNEVVGRNEVAKRLDNDAQLLLETMNQFYIKHCTDAVFPVISEVQLRDEGLLFGGGFINPWGGNYQFGIDRLLPRNPKLIVSLEFDSAIDADFVAGLSDNAKAVGNTVTWTRNGSLSQTSNGIRNQLDRAAFGTPLC